MDEANALRQVTLRAGGLTLAGFSRAGLATYVQVPELDLCFDMGECPLSSLGLDHVFLTHAHGDHARCLPRHWQLRRMLKHEREAAYFLPEAIREGCVAWIRAEARFEGVPEGRERLPDLRGLAAGEALIELPHRPDLRARAFDVRHSIPSLGYTIFAHKKKLLPELAGLPGQEIARLRKAGAPVSFDVDEPLISFIGDCDGRTLVEQRHIWDSPVLVLEATFLMEDELAQASAKMHTHIDEIRSAFEAVGQGAKVQHLVLKHFSLRYSTAEIAELVAARLPEAAASRVKLLV